MQIQRHIGSNIATFAIGLNKVLQGWLIHYGWFAINGIQRILAHINTRLEKCCMKKFTRWKGAALCWVLARWKETPILFVHWQ